jgi:hypothetical protein
MKSKQLDAALAAGVMFALSLPHKLASIIAGNAARISVLAIYYGAVVGLSANNANAEFITQADFDSSTVVSDLNNLGPAPDVFTTPFTLGIYTFTTDNGILGYYATQGLDNPRALGTTAEDLGWIRIEIAPSAQITKFGFFVRTLVSTITKPWPSSTPAGEHRYLTPCGASVHWFREYCGTYWQRTYPGCRPKFSRSRG